jgi:antitoxin HicB
MSKKDISKEVEYYANLPYQIVIEKWEDQGGYYAARVVELPGLLMTGDTPAEAIAELEDVKRDWIETYLELGNKMPEPLNLRSHSGNIRVRMEPSLHSDLALFAELEGVSLNQFITTALSQAVGVEKGRRGNISPVMAKETKAKYSVKKRSSRSSKKDNRPE